jgi:hypothetical protein
MARLPEEKELNESRLNDNQMECIIAAILTLGSLPHGGTSPERALNCYAEMVKRVRMVGYLNPPGGHWSPAGVMQASYQKR